MGEARRFKVVQWATGNIGLRALQAVIENPTLDLVGVYVTSPDKIGRDAATITGTDTLTGIIATNDVEEILALDADCVLYMPPTIDFDQVARILAGGKNIITPRAEFVFAAGMAPERRAQIETACAEGSTSIYSTGGSPGFITDVLPLALLGQQTKFECLTINEYADLTSRNSPEMLFGKMGYGSDNHRLSDDYLDHVRADFAGGFNLLASGMGFQLDETTVECDVALATQDAHMAAGLLRANTVAGTRLTVTGWQGGRPRFRFRAHWYCTPHIDADWGDLMYSGWRVTVVGDSSMSIRIEFDVSREDYPNFTPGVTANRIVNAIPFLCQARPGIRNTLDLPPILPRKAI